MLAKWLENVSFNTLSHHMHHNMTKTKTNQYKTIQNKIEPKQPNNSNKKQRLNSE